MSSASTLSVVKDFEEDLFTIDEVFAHNSAYAAVLAYVDCGLFLAVAIVLARQLIKQRQEEKRADAIPPISLTGGRTRFFFLLALCISNAARALSLVFDAVIHFEVRMHRLEHPVQSWTNDVFMIFPSLLFLSTYSIVILFWAQVYYAAVLVSHPLLRPICIFVNIAVYGVFIIISIVTFLLSAWKEYNQYIYFVVGLLYIICSILFFYYGLQVSGQLRDRSRRQLSGNARQIGQSRNKSVINRVLVLTLTCPLIFLVRGMSEVLFGVGLVKTVGPPGIDRQAWDSIVYFVTEWIPSLLILFVFWPANRRSPPLSHRSSLDVSSNGTLTSPLLPAQQQQQQQQQETHQQQRRFYQGRRRL
ncbi:hypothetical protein FOL47_008825 [Perkinsus chesapeaki]|uniref:THH1/TOM1/TOM3 domain-containing protein n=1 Tax=Perkinsus chesapeaki TaxID=330153 RepID=A0A7J6LBS2_PERCH|nr:hypothetical protein FOL47_008825 [Perkinsus chesapeaki]